MGHPRPALGSRRPRPPTCRAPPFQAESSPRTDCVNHECFPIALGSRPLLEKPPSHGVWLFVDPVLGSGVAVDAPGRAMSRIHFLQEGSSVILTAHHLADGSTLPPPKFPVPRVVGRITAFWGGESALGGRPLRYVT